MSQPVGVRPRILVVDDEQVIRDMLADFLSMEGYQVETAEDGVAATERLEAAPFDLVLSDLKMPRMGGIALIDAISQAAPQAVTVIMTGFGTVETAIDAMKRGAYDYVLKPFKLDEVVHVVRRGLDKQRMVTENLRLREALSLYKVSEAIAASLSLDQVLETVADSCREELHADAVWTWLDDGEGGLFERQALRGATVEPTASIGKLDARGVAAHFDREPFLLEQGDAGARFFAEAPGGALTSLVAVPLRIRHRGSSGGTRLLGFLAAASTTRGKRFDEGQRKLLTIVGSRAAAAIENA
jgi:CheY-like chemotaxis protein